jgi:hypothetical protein
MSLIQGLKDVFVEKFGYEMWLRAVEERREELIRYVLDGDIQPFLTELGDLNFTQMTVEDVAEISQASTDITPKSKQSLTIQNRIQLSKNIWVKCSDLNGNITTIVNQACGTGTTPTISMSNMGDLWLPAGAKLHSLTISGCSSDAKLTDLDVHISVLGKSPSFANLTEAKVATIYSGRALSGMTLTSNKSNTIDLGDYTLTEDRQICLYYRSTNDIPTNRYFTGTRTIIYSLP